MNKKTLKLFICLGCIPALATNANPISSDTVKVQSKTEMKTLINTNLRLKSWGISVSPFAQFGKIGNQNGISALLHLNNQWAIGVTAMHSIRERRDIQVIYEGKQRFNGLHVEYTPKANSLFHLSFPLLVGAISQEKAAILRGDEPIPPTDLHIIEVSTHNHSHFNDFSNWERSLGVQPGINLEVNLFKYAKLFGGVNYRFAFGKNATNDVQGVSGQFGFKFGMFNKVIKK